MVLSFEKANAKLKENVNRFQLMVLDVSEIPLCVNRQFFGWSIEILKHIRYVTLVNQLKSEDSERTYIDCKILHDAIDIIFSNGKFTDAQLREYYEVKRKLHLFFKSHENIARIGSHVNFESDYFLLGAEMDWELEDVPENLDAKYEIMLMDFVYKESDVDEFINSVKNLVDDHVKVERVRLSS